MDQVEAPTEESIVEDIYSTEEVKENDGSKVKVTQKKVEVVSKDEEDQQQASQKDEPREKLEDLLHVTPKETDTEPSNGISREITCVEVEGAVQNVDETTETENEGAKTKNVNVSEKEVYDWSNNAICIYIFIFLNIFSQLLSVQHNLIVCSNMKLNLLCRFLMN